MKTFGINIYSRTSPNARWVLAAVAHLVAMVPVTFKALVGDKADGIKLEHVSTGTTAELFDYTSKPRNKFKLYREGLEVQEWAKSCYEVDAANGLCKGRSEETMLRGTEKDRKQVRKGKRFGTRAALARAQTMTPRKQRALTRKIVAANTNPESFRLSQGRRFEPVV